MKNSNVIPQDLVRTLYKCYGAAVACELEDRWQSVGSGNFGWSLMRDLEGSALSASSFIKQFGRWKQWYKDDSSFASGSVDRVVDVMAWSKYRRVITAAEAQGIRDALICILQFSSESISLETFTDMLPVARTALINFVGIDREPGTKTMFRDKRDGQKFRRSELAVLAPRGVRPTAAARRWKSIEAAVATLEAAERISRIAERAKAAAKTWTFPKRDLQSLRLNAERLAEQLSTVLQSAHLPDRELREHANLAFSTLAKQMSLHFDAIQIASNTPQPLKKSVFETKKFEPMV